MTATAAAPRHENTALLADILSLGNDGRYPTLELDPQQRRRRRMEALTAQLEALSQTKAAAYDFYDVNDPSMGVTILPFSCAECYNPPQRVGKR